MQGKNKSGLKLMLNVPYILSFAHHETLSSHAEQNI